MCQLNLKCSKASSLEKGGVVFVTETNCGIELFFLKTVGLYAGSKSSKR